MMYRQVFIPSQRNHVVEIPEQLFGKTIECILFEIETDEKVRMPKTKKGALKSLSGAFPKFPSVEEIRKESWPSKW